MMLGLRAKLLRVLNAMARVIIMNFRMSVMMLRIHCGVMVVINVGNLNSSLISLRVNSRA